MALFLQATAKLNLVLRITGRRRDGYHLLETLYHARELGADVPFFLRGGSQWGRGIGDELQDAADTPARSFLLLLPPFGCPTAEVYKTYAARLNGGDVPASIRGDNIPWHEGLAQPL